MSHRLATALRRYRWPVLVGWLALTVVAGIASAALPGHLSGGGWYVSGSQSQVAAEALKSGFAGRGASSITLVVRDERHTSGTPEFDVRVERAMREMVGDRRLDRPSTYGWLGASPDARKRFVGRDGRTAITFAGLRLDEGTARRVLPQVQKDLEHRYQAQGLRVSLVGAASFWGEVNRLSEEGLRGAELITLPLVLIILLLLFRGVLKAVVALVIGGTAIVLTFGLLSIIAARYELSIFVQNAATMIGFGVSVDYSLFMISRYAEELARRRDHTAALACTLRTSGRTVLFSGGIVIVAICSLTLIDLGAIRSIALGVAAVVALGVVTSLILLPVVLLLLGDRIKAAGGGRDPATAGRRWRTIARHIMARPAVFLAAAVVATLVLTLPVLDLRTFSPDARILPESSPVRAGFDTVRQEFGQGVGAPIQVVVRADVPLTDSSAAGRVIALNDRLAGLDHVTRVDSALNTLRTARPDRPFAALTGDAFARLPQDARRQVDYFVSSDRRTVVFEVIGDDFAAGDRSRAILASARAVARELGDHGLRVSVGGETAEGVDANDAIQNGLLPVLIFIAGVTYLLLLVAFRSLFLPLKAILMNLLSLGATYGILVLVFQKGWGIKIIDAQHFGYVQNFVPILLLAVLFSLSTDYEVFLLNRIREERESGVDDATSVANGLARTAPLISGAAVLMIAVFGAFTISSILPIQELGLGLAFGIALDATVVRIIVVPAAMRLMGRWNWWLPGRRRTPPARFVVPEGLRSDLAAQESGHLEVNRPATRPDSRSTGKNVHE